MRAVRDVASRAGKSRPALLGLRTALLGSRTALCEMRTNFVAINKAIAQCSVIIIIGSLLHSYFWDIMLPSPGVAIYESLYRDVKMWPR